MAGQAQHLIQVANVAGLAANRAQGLQFGHDPIYIGLSAARDDDCGPGPQQCFGHGPAKAAGGAGDDDDFILQ